MRDLNKEWMAKPEYQSLLYFCQLLDDMVWEATRDSHRAPAMNTYHLCVEVQRTWDENRTSSRREGLIGIILDELHITGENDPTVTAHFAEAWSKLTFVLKHGTTQDTKVGAVFRFSQHIEIPYLKRCRDEIQRLVDHKAEKKEKAKTLTGAFCSYIQNVGYTPRHISRMISQQFFSREMDKGPVRELQDFFKRFPAKSSEFKVFISVTEQLAMAMAMGSSDVAELKGRLPSTARDRESFHPKADVGEKIMVFQKLSAFDEFGAVERAEAKMAFVRAVAYTARADVNLAWQDEAVVTSKTNSAGYPVCVRHEPLKKRYRDSESYHFDVVGEVRRAVLEDQLPPPDANRLRNALLSYANAFHSESPATQLVTLWSALEGLLPASSSEGRIDAVLRYALACQRALYLRNLFKWSFIEHLATDREPFLKLLDKIPEYKANLSRFVALLGFPRDESLSDELGQLAAKSPLTTQRGFVLHKASKNVQDLQKLVEAHVQRVDWQLRRVYRERNRIVHRADPSPNVGTLILNLNEYLAAVFEVLFTASAERPYKLGLDGLFEAVFLDEKFRSKKVSGLLRTPLSAENSSTVLGFDLK